MGASSKTRKENAVEETSRAALPVSPREWMDGGVALLDLNLKVLSASPELVEWLELEADQVRGRLLSELLLQRCGVTLGDWSQVCEGTLPFANKLLPYDSSSGKKWLKVEIARNEAGWFVRLGSALPPLGQMVEDGGWRSKPEEEDPEKARLRVRLLRAESQLNDLVQRWPGVIFNQRADFSFRYVSPRIEALTGVSADVWLRQPQRFWQIVHETDVEELRQQCKHAAQSREGVTTTFRIRHALTGQVSYILESRKAQASRTGLVLSYEGVWLDITRQTIAEKRLTAAAWKETLAALTMGLAHDFGNVMSGILSLSELLMSQAGPNHPYTESLNLIKHNSLQASQLVHRIINLHRSKTGERQYHDLNQVVPELADLVRKVLPRRIRIETTNCTEALPVYMDAVEFRQVLLNLALNAADAMPERGSLSFQTRLITTPPPCAGQEHLQGSLPRLPIVCLSVRDTGCGIAARHLPHLFDPFFTTKPLNKGSGLGLYNARVFVEEHNGAIMVESVEGMGSTFHIYLPQADFTESDRQMGQSQRRRCLMLVGPSGPIADSTAEFLRTQNFYVVVTHTPLRAMELLTSEERGFVGVMILAAPQDIDMLSLVPEIQDRKLASKTILQIIGGNQDQVETGILTKADLVITNDVDEDGIIRKLNSLFAV